MNVTYRIDKDILYIAIEGRVDASNAAEAENNIFKGNYRTKTNICDSKQQPYADMLPETPPTDRVTRTRTKKSAS